MLFICGVYSAIKVKGGEYKIGKMLPIQSRKQGRHVDKQIDNLNIYIF